MAEHPDFEYILVDSTIVRARRRTKALSSLQAATAAQRNDITQIAPLLDGLKTNYDLDPSHRNCRAMDTDYDGARAMDAIAAIGATPTVPRRPTAASWRKFDAYLNKDRNTVERTFITLSLLQAATAWQWIKHFRRIAARYDKPARNYLGCTNLVGAPK